MTALEIAAMAGSLYLDEDITADDAFITSALDAALSQLPAAAYPEAEAAVSAVAGTWYTLPTDLVEIVEIKADGAPYYGDYDFRSGRIRFAEDGQYTVVYRKLPASISSMTDTPQVPGAYGPALACWMAGYYKCRDDDENPDGLRLKQQAAQEAYAVAAGLRRAKRNIRAGRPAVIVER